MLASLKILYKYNFNKDIVNKNITNNFLNKVLLLLVFFFPLIILLRSSAINITTILVSIIMFFYFFKKKQVNIFKNNLLIYIIVFFSYIFVNSIIHFTSFDLLLKSLSNFRYLLLSMGVFLSLHIASENKKKFFIYFNIIIIFLVSIDILYQYFFYEDIFGFAPGMCTNVLIKCQRFSGVFGEELIAGSYLSQIGFLILMLFLNLELNKIYFSFFFKIILCIFLLTIIILTGERAALLIVTVSLFFISFFKKKVWAKDNLYISEFRSEFFRIVL